MRFRAIAREVAAGAVTPPILAAVVAAGLAGAAEPEGRVLNFVPRRVQEIMRESRVSWKQYSQFEYVAAGLAVAAMVPRKAGRLFAVQRAGPDFDSVPCVPSAYHEAPLCGACCDVYLPKGSSNATTFGRMLVFVPGGAWSHGFKSFYALTSRRLADELGCPVAVVGYDLYPKADGAAQVQQVEHALRWAEAGAVVGPEAASVALLLYGAQVAVV